MTTLCQLEGPVVRSTLCIEVRGQDFSRCDRGCCLLCKAKSRVNGLRQGLEGAVMWVRVADTAGGGRIVYLDYAAMPSGLKIFNCFPSKQVLGVKNRSCLAAHFSLGIKKGRKAASFLLQVSTSQFGLDEPSPTELRRNPTIFKPRSHLRPIRRGELYLIFLF